MLCGVLLYQPWGPPVPALGASPALASSETACGSGLEIRLVSRPLVAAESGELGAEFPSLTEILGIFVAGSRGTVTLPEPWWHLCVLLLLLWADFHLSSQQE